jgi:asparagine synthase (glutamine-hydrolysing)
MCGICGKLVSIETRACLGVLESMTDAIRHRGPDDDGFYVSGQVGLGFRRLSIIVNTGISQLRTKMARYGLCSMANLQLPAASRGPRRKGHIFKTKTDTGS